jgi:hypothetical protein
MIECTPESSGCYSVYSVVLRNKRIRQVYTQRKGISRTLAQQASWRKNDPAGRDFLMEALEGVPYRLADPRATKPVIESKHQLRDMLALSSIISGTSEYTQGGDCRFLTYIPS